VSGVSASESALVSGSALGPVSVSGLVLAWASARVPASEWELVLVSALASALVWASELELARGLGLASAWEPASA
jgi:hypothetical protein